MTPSSSPTTIPLRDARRRAARLISSAGVLGAVLLAACAPSPVVEAPTAAPELPARSVDGAAHYRVVPNGTRVYARVFRGGRMAKLGHNHVVLFPGVRGDLYLADEPGASLFDVAVSVASAVVDPPALRRSQGPDFQSDISDDARTRTRRNMLGEEVLDAARHPYVIISSSAIEGPLEEPRVTLDIIIRGATRQLTLPMTLSYDEQALVAEGRLDLLQSDFDIEPFTVLGGALKVKDRIELVFEIAAERVELERSSQYRPSPSPDSFLESGNLGS